MKIWNANKMKDDVNKMLSFFKNGNADINYLTKLQQKVNFNKDIDVVECSTIFLLASVCEQIAISKEPNLAIMSIDDIEALDKFENKLTSQIYANIKQNMYITLILSKPNGREFAEGSLKYSEEEYETFDKAIREELAEQVEVVNKLTGLKLNAIINM